MICKKCGANLPNDSKFCQECGEKVVKEKKQVYCTHCGEKIDFDVRVCPYCGKEVQSGINPALDEESVPLEILSFLFPVAGLILWAAWKNKTPIKANGIIKWAAVGLCANILLKIIQRVYFGY